MTWQLAVKKATCQTETDYRGEEYEEMVNPSDPMPLLNASRDVRIAAVPVIPKLLDAIKKRGQSLLDNIDKAEKAVAKL